MKKYYMYILTNKFNSVFYIGVTSNLTRRVNEHKNFINRSFSSRYKTIKLVYYESYTSIRFAIAREKQLKNWKRSWKIELIRNTNKDYSEIFIN